MFILKKNGGGEKIKKYKKWTEKEVGVLIKEHGRGTRLKNIARLLDRSVKATSNKAIKIGLKRVPTWTEKEVGILVSLYTQGKRYKKIAEIIKKSEAAIKNKIKRIRKNLKKNFRGENSLKIRERELKEGFLKDQESLKKILHKTD